MFFSCKTTSEVPETQIHITETSSVRKFSQIIGDPTKRVQTRSTLRSQGHTTLILEVEPKHIDEAMQDKNWVKAMQDELV